MIPKCKETDKEIESLNKSNIYSTEEQKVGTWIDGKPLYRKTIKTTLSSGSNFLAKPSKKLELLINLYGIIEYVSNKDGYKRMMGLTRTHYNDINYQVGWFYSDTNDMIGIEVGTNYLETLTAYITYEYTKTAD